MGRARGAAGRCGGAVLPRAGRLAPHHRAVAACPRSPRPVPRRGARGGWGARLLAAALCDARACGRGDARHRGPALPRAPRCLPAVRRARDPAEREERTCHLGRVHPRDAGGSHAGSRRAHAGAEALRGRGGAAAHPQARARTGAPPVPHACAVWEPGAWSGPRSTAVLRQAGGGSLMGPGRLPRRAAADARSHEPVYA
jgi:hypothetical protein